MTYMNNVKQLWFLGTALIVDKLQEEQVGIFRADPDVEVLDISLNSLFEEEYLKTN